MKKIEYNNIIAESINPIDISMSNTILNEDINNSLDNKIGLNIKKRIILRKK